MVVMGPDTKLATPLRAPRVGLLASASVVDLPGIRWGFGVEWYPEFRPVNNDDGHGVRAIKCDPTPVNKSDFMQATTEEAYPFAVFAIDWCSTFGTDPRNLAGRARRLLEATQSYSIAAEFASGVLNAMETLGNTPLYDQVSVDILAGGPLTPEKALAVLDMEIATELTNQPGMIHVTVQQLSRLMDLGAIRRDGDRWRTAFDNIVVADGAYHGSIDGNPSYMVATPPVEIALGPIRTVDVTDQAQLVNAVDWTVNDYVMWAERDVIVMWEPHLLHAAIDVTLP